jgi:hypothetical protein
MDVRWGARLGAAAEMVQHVQKLALMRDIALRLRDANIVDDHITHLRQALMVA